jgi:tetratricopeptide (TPR) repeat protein
MTRYSRVNKFSNNALLIAILTACTIASSQTHGTIRHYKERIDVTPPEIAQAEDAIQKNDFSGAETLLRKAIDKDPNNYQAWFDLGFVLNRLGRADESIAAYRKSVTAKPEVFESNLNLGLMLERNKDPNAEQFLRAATTLKPTVHPEEGQERAWLALAHLVENKKPLSLRPRTPSLIFLPGCCSNGKRNLLRQSTNTNRCWRWIQSLPKLPSDLRTST